MVNSIAGRAVEQLRPHGEFDAVDGGPAEAECWGELGGDGGGEIEGRRRGLVECGELLGREGDLEGGRSERRESSCSLRYFGELGPLPQWVGHIRLRLSPSTGRE